MKNIASFVLIAMLAFVPSALAKGNNKAAAWRGSPKKLQKLDNGLQKIVQNENDPGDPVPVIIKVKPGNRTALKNFLTQSGKRVRGEYASVDALATELTSEDLYALSDSDSVDSFSVDADVDAEYSSTSNAYRGSVQMDTMLQALGLASSTRRYTGSGVGVAIVDSGIGASDDLRGRVIANYDFTSGVTSAAQQGDGYGHGTHIAGLIGADGTTSLGVYAGIAPSVRLINLKVLDKNGNGRTSNVMLAIEYAIANKDRLGIDVMNLSLGHPILEPALRDPLVQVVEKAVRAKIVVVASAGNFGKNQQTGQPGYGGITSPGNAPSAITVGAYKTDNTASRSDDVMALYSSRGPSWYDGFAKPDLVAPGDKLVSLSAVSSTLCSLLSGDVLKVGTGNFLKLSGTSMAAGVTSGVVALVIEARRARTYGNNQASPTLVKAILEYSAIPMLDPSTGQKYNWLTEGAGAINPNAATGMAESLNVSDYQSSWGGGGSSFSMSSDLAVAGQHIVWGNRLLDGESIVWGGSIVWGNAIVWGSSIVWGQDVVWSNTTWANAIVWGSGLLTTTSGNAIVWGGSIDPNAIVWGASVNPNGQSAQNVK